MDVMWCVWLPGYYGSTIYRPLEKNSGKSDISKLYGEDDAE